MAVDAFLFLNTYRSRVEVQVRDLRSDHFASAGAGMSRKTKHGMQPWLNCCSLHKCQKLVDFGRTQEQAVPQFLPLDRGQLNLSDLALDFRPRLERRFFRRLGELEPLVRERPAQKLGLDRPIP